VDADIAWCPPGHGDIYLSIQSSGMLDALLDAGVDFAFISNADNLGAVMDEAILGYFASEQMPFLMEVADRTDADRKGGHLARRCDGRLMLREVAQCPPDELESFADTTRFRYFNTNSIWLHLPSLKRTLRSRGGILDLPLIRNSKTLDPRDPSSPPVYQLETAMGAAIEAFEGAGALRVPRSRFAPVKLCSDLLAIWSDAYELTPDFHVAPSRGVHAGPPVVKLDPRYYSLFDDLRERFPAGAPSLRECQSLTVQGNVVFGEGVVVRGHVTVSGGDKTTLIPDNAVLEERRATSD